MLAIIDSTGLPGLCIAIGLAVLLTAAAAVFLWRRRDVFFGSKRRAQNDEAFVRNDRKELTLFVWTGLALLLITFFFQAWGG